MRVSHDDVVPQRSGTVTDPGLREFNLSKIERAERRVDVDDLTAIAVALGVSPATLLLPPLADETPTRVTGAGTVASSAAWDWADGHRPILAPDEATGADEGGLLAHAMRTRPEGRRTDRLVTAATRDADDAEGDASNLLGQLTKPELIKLLDDLKEALTHG